MQGEDFKSNRHSCYNLKYHLVVVSKYRKPVITDEIFNSIKIIADDIFVAKNKCRVLCINHGIDHVHILFEAPPQIKLSVLVNSFKTVSSRLIRRDYNDFLSTYFWKPYFWTESYYIGSVGDITTQITQLYIENQKTE